MPDILIHGISMPRERDHLTITINANGTVQPLMDMYCPIIATAVELPEHGDLIDLSELQKFPIRLDHYDKEHGDKHFVYGIESLMEYAECLPVVVPAERRDADA